MDASPFRELPFRELAFCELAFCELAFCELPFGGSSSGGRRSSVPKGRQVIARGVSPWCRSVDGTKSPEGAPLPPLRGSANQFYPITRGLRPWLLTAAASRLRRFHTHMHMLEVFLAAACVLLMVAPSLAQDTVIVATGNGSAKHSGRIVDYTGRQLLLETPGGQRTFPAEDVLAVKTQYGPQQTAADEAFAAGRFDQALALYRQAGTEESRRWVRRQIMARVVWCYRILDQMDQAGEWFLLLIAADPSTQYFDCIPLAWMPGQPPVAVEQAARLWIQRKEPAAVLLGASHLLGGDARSLALAREKLGRLISVPDPRIALLARAQTWRTAMAGAEQLDAWSATIQRIPAKLAAGPYFVLGRARMQQQQWEQAALALMRIPILYPSHRRLAAEALLHSATSLERLDRTAESLRLYRELTANHPKSRPAAEARDRIQEIAGQ